ncbi:MAG: sigma-54 dependent transcriptional regulator [Bacteroidota bacterium]|nr:sigma-54 dependent transcriptional regulator [Bacteroidota bacterium]
MSDRILIADDEEIIRDSISFVLQKENYLVDTAADGAEALAKHLENPFDIIITDIEMPEMKGTELLDRVLQATPETFVIIITAFASIETAIGALRRGAYDYIIKPIEFDDLIIKIERLSNQKRLAQENIFLRTEVNRQYDFHNIVGKSAAMQKLFETVKCVSKSCGNVIIYGNSGTGKELIARAIHYNGPRSAKPFVTINCGAVVETLFESELFGHRKGAFTGATSDKVGLFKVADKGTIFLDEVSEIPLHLQVKLLRAIEQKEIYSVGDSTPQSIDVRIIASTNKNLSELVELGQFREDLFYRLHVVQLKLPSLTERKNDIPLLVQHFIQKYNKQLGKLVRGADNKAMCALINNNWKGEVRELENAVERALIFASADLLTLNDLPDNIVRNTIQYSTESIQSLDSALKEFEKNYLIRILDIFDYDKEMVAEALKISTSTLYRRLQEFGIPMKKDDSKSV